MLSLRSRRPLAALTLLALALAAATVAPSPAVAASAARRCSHGRARLGASPCLRLKAPRLAADPAKRALALQRIGEAFVTGPAQRRLLRGTRARRRAQLPGVFRPGAAPALARAAGGLLRLPGAPVFGAWQDDPDVAPKELPIERRRALDEELQEGEDGELRGHQTEARNGDTALLTSGVMRDTLTSCPDADGAVRGTWEFSIGWDAQTDKGGLRQQITNRASYEATVGDDARLRRFRYRAEVDVEHGGYGVDRRGRRQHIPTRRFRSVFTRANLDPRHRDEDPSKDYAANPPEGELRGPQGSRMTDAQYAALFQQVLITMALLEGDARAHLLKAERRWYDDFACVSGEIDGPGRLRPGASARYAWQPLARDGRPLQAPAQIAGSGGVSLDPASGAVAAGSPFATTVRLDSKDGGWFDTIVVSRRGRGRASKSIAVERGEPRRWALGVSLHYAEDMGAGVAPTHVDGVGSVEATVGGGFAEGSGDYRGSEWDAQVDNICGQDMLRTRGFAGRAIVGAKIHDDGEVTVTFGVPGRPFDFSWVVTLPLRDGASSETHGDNPFCGEPHRAHTTTVVSLSARPLD